MSVLDEAKQTSHHAHHREIEPMSTTPTKAKTRTWIAGLISALAGIAALTIVAPTAQAQFDFQVDTFSHEVNDDVGDPETQAGAHPFVVQTNTLFGVRTDSNGDPLPDGTMKDIEVELPPGFVGDPTEVPSCSQADLLTGVDFLAPGCHQSAQIGLLILHTLSEGPVPMPIYNMERPADRPAQFAIALPAFLNSSVKPDGSVVVSSENISQGLPSFGVTVDLWGVPADPAHDPERAFFGFFCYPYDGSGGFAPCPAGAPERPLLTNPTSCGEEQVVRLRANSWQEPDEVITDQVLLPAVEGCDKLEFNPSISVTPNSSAADTPSAYRVDLSVPQNQDHNALASAHLRDAEVTLPDGVAVNPAAADGLESCTEAEIGLDSTDPDQCPDGAKIGTVELETPLLDDPMTGAVYQAEQDNNPFGSTLAMYLVIEGSGVRQKLAGEISPDPDTGQLTTTFEDQPQLPFSELSLRLKGGSRAPLVNPSTCGTKTTMATFTPWSAPDSGPPVEASDSFEITEGPNGLPCAADLGDRPFDPELSGGLLSSTAGGFSPFVFKLTRPDGHQEILSTEVSPPEGGTAKLAGLPLCEEADVAAGTCNESNRIGTAIVGAGAGPSPFYIKAPNEGKVYMAGPYDPDGGGPADEAPLSMLIQVPAIAGPFDLGEVNVRAAVYVDPETARLNVVSDEIPQILEGIPLRVRDIRVKVDRESFTVAPTDCDPKQVEAVAHGVNGAEANLATHFQVGDCGGLDFGPEFDFVANNNDATDRSDHPALDTTVDLNQPAGAYASANGTRPQANIAKAVVTLPKSIILDQDSLETICTRADYAADNCPANTQYGTAIAHSPLLDEPLQGPVYLRASDNPLPDLVADLNGIIDVDLAGAISQTGGQNSRLRTTFGVVPDVAVSSFNLKLRGGNDGLLVNSQNVCSAKNRRKVDVKVFGQNNLTAHQSPRISIRACERKADRKAKRLERRASKLKRKARKTKRKGDKAKARKLKRKAKRLQRKARKTRRAAS
jgi:hypothetical protein